MTAQGLGQIYAPSFYAGHADGSQKSAAVVAPLIMDLFAPASVVDVGCGIGTWLQVFAELGVTRLQGLDGDHVNAASLRIPASQFQTHDLRQPLPDLGRFDVALSLEVAEHLPGVSAFGFVAGLTRLAPVVVFSAAIPGQGGTEHVNEQWPEYWEELFAAHDYVQLDPFRPLIWHDQRVEWWYRQNLLVYVACSRMEADTGLGKLPQAVGDERMTLISRRTLRQYVDLENGGLRRVLRALPRLLVQSLKRRFSG